MFRGEGAIGRRQGRLSTGGRNGSGQQRAAVDTGKEQWSQDDVMILPLSDVEMRHVM